MKSRHQNLRLDRRNEWWRNERRDGVSLRSRARCSREISRGRILQARPIQIERRGWPIGKVPRLEE